MSILRICMPKKVHNLKTVNYGNIFFRSTSDSKLDLQSEHAKPPKSHITYTEQELPKTTAANEPIQAVKGANDLLIKPEPILPPMTENDALNASAPFSEVPGPKILQHIANMWSFIPVFGNQVTTSTIQYILGANRLLGAQLSWGRNAFIFRYLLNEYGPIVRLQGPFGGDVVVLSRPEDALAVFTSEGRYPIRSSLDCIEKYRLQYRRFKHAGPFLMFGEDWEKLRGQIEAPLHNTVQYQFSNLETTSNEFVQRIKKIRNRQDEVPAGFVNEIFKYCLESLCAMMLGQKLGFMNKKEGISTSEPARLLKAFHGATEAIRGCESGLHLWKFVETPSWKNLVKHCDAIDGILSKYLREAEVSLRTKQEDITLNITRDDNVPLLEALLLQEGIFPEDILTVFLDMMLIGVNATAHSISFLLYHLARCPRAQRQLADEVKTIPDTLTPEILVNAKYLQACIKESLRLKPPIPFLSRILTRDIVVHNYRIPKGTVVLMATYLSSIREEHFDDAHKFIPERWLSPDSPDSSFACIPFGYGPKACLARNLAEMQLGMLLVKILRSFRIEYHYGDINSTNKLLAAPDKPLKFRFLNRLI